MRDNLIEIEVIIDVDDNIKQWFLEINSKPNSDALPLPSKFLTTILKIDQEIIDDKFLEIARSELFVIYKDKISNQDIEFPRVEIIESYEGSWIIEALVYIPVVYSVVKITSDLHKTYDGIVELQRRIQIKLDQFLENYFRKLINSTSKEVIPNRFKSVVSSKVKLEANQNDKIIIEKNKEDVSLQNEKITKVKRVNENHLTTFIAWLSILGLIYLFWSFSKSGDINPLINRIEVLENEIIILGEEGKQMKNRIEILETINLKNLEAIEAANAAIERWDSNNK